MIVTTCCYIFNGDHVLLLHRNKKNNDINESKWIGVGGKVEKNESPYECIIREVKEETHLSIINPELKGIVTFPDIYYGEDELMFLYTCHQFSGELSTDCNEGDLAWISVSEVNDLNMWEGDYHFFDWFKDQQIHQAVIEYQDNQLTNYIEY